MITEAPDPELRYKFIEGSETFILDSPFAVKTVIEGRCTYQG
jgi:hypothetical protein